jgi:hypothetical protein
MRYQVLNVGGSALLMLNAAYHGALPSVSLNAVWGAIGVAALVRLLRRSRRDPAGGGAPDGASRE